MIFFSLVFYVTLFLVFAFNLLRLVLFFSEDIGAEKPERQIFDEAFEQARFWSPGISRDMVLHIGDSLAAGLIQSNFLHAFILCQKVYRTNISIFPQITVEREPRVFKHYF